MIIDSGVENIGSGPARVSMLSFLVSEIADYQPRATVYVPELDQTFRLSELEDDDGYVRTVSCTRV